MNVIASILLRGTATAVVASVLLRVIDWAIPGEKACRLPARKRPKKAPRKK